MDAQLLEKLARAEEDLVSAMLTEDGELAAYEFAWVSLLDEISQASASGEVKSTTLAVADDVVARISTLVDCCLSLSSASPPSSPILPLNTRTPPPSRTTSSFIPEAHEWLLKNIANPYPPSEFKAFLAQQYDSSVSAVSSWFANARRRMGWTTLCRDFFSNCRADAVDAAYRVLVQGEPSNQPSLEVTHAFVAMKVAAEGFYATSIQNVLDDNLDIAVKDMLVEGKMLAEDGRWGETDKMERLRGRGKCSRKKISSQKISRRYPQSNILHSSSLLPSGDSPLDEGGDEGDIAPPLSASRRGRLSSSRAAHVDTHFPSSSPNASLSSPLPNTDSSENDSHGQMPRSDPVSQSFTGSERRKRRLSDADAIKSPKRPRFLMTGPHLHAVSDPLPLSMLESEVSIDEWFKANFDALFDLPPPVDVIEPDLSTQWEVELFNNYSIPANPQNALIPPIQDGQLYSSTDLAAFDHLLRSLEIDGFVAPPEIIQPPTMTSVSDPISECLPLLPDLSRSIDWTAFLSEGSSEPASNSMSQSYVDSALPEIGLSISQLPRAWTTVVS